jgi:hypothetical protein
MGASQMVVGVFSDCQTNNDNGFDYYREHPLRSSPKVLSSAPPAEASIFY